MFGQAGNLIILGVMAAFLCSTPMLSGTAPASVPMHAHSHDFGADSGDHQNVMQMQMVFDYGYKTTLWFSSLRTDTIASYIAVLLGLGLLAFVHEGLTVYRKTRATTLGSSADALEFGLREQNLGLSYMLMLAVMSMNAGVFVAVLAGFGAGFCAFGGERGPLGGRSDACHGQ
ncbi:CTR type copper ion transporter [Volvox carteri f. nagariensis]|uniref:Copper transport protein n=1 Tax=Volvox carteri f. nagariensis TaxID=3068 RepID=D8UEI4_VOLCA|nr:CTR type copper ion transporter [Volvox carteri f. nagariensis]EFJ41888.1 CTR type copper ion transporter [Volvox carteri f. nagariensis]|eukprot:XP_002957086.1 CTR type copper ion transporter [Volvox carteri f. nagariensis]